MILIFRTSSALAAAYGIAVTTTMLITTLIFYRLVRDRWGWSPRKALLLLTPFMAFDVAFLSANLPKTPAGAWLPLLVGLALVVQMTTWRRGRDLVNDRLRESGRSLDAVLADGVVHVKITFGFLDEPDVPAVLAALEIPQHQFDSDEVTTEVGCSCQDERCEQPAGGGSRRPRRFAARRTHGARHR